MLICVDDSGAVLLYIISVGRILSSIEWWSEIMFHSGGLY